MKPWWREGSRILNSVGVVAEFSRIEDAMEFERIYHLAEEAEDLSRKTKKLEAKLEVFAGKLFDITEDEEYVKEYVTDTAEIEASARRNLVEGFVDEEAMFADGLDECLIGAARIFNRTVPLYCLDSVKRKTLREFRRSQGGAPFDPEDDLESDVDEYVEFNILGAYVGEHTPAFAIMIKDEID
jgi:hypothetical protein